MSDSIVFLNGKIVPLSEAHISPLDRGFLFGDGVYEVIKCTDGKIIFYQEHIERLKNSLAGLALPFNDFAILTTTITQLLEKNDLTQGDVLVYLQITRGAYQARSHEFPSGDISPTVFIMTTRCPDLSANKKGIQLTTHNDTRWYWCSLKTVNLLGNVLAKQNAVEQQAQEVVLVRDGIVLECSASSIAIVKDGKVYAHPAEEYILPSITMSALQRACDKEGVPFIDKKFDVQEMKDADEILVLSTVRDINHAVLVDREKVGNKDAALLERLHKAFDELAMSS